MNKWAMISQPMKGVDHDEITATRERAKDTLEKKGYLVKDTFFNDSIGPYLHGGVYMLGMSLLSMAYCDTVYFCRGWEKARGCRLENEVALQYGLEVMFEEEEE